MNEIIDAVTQLQRQQKKLTKHPRTGEGKGNDFPSNDGSYPALPLETGSQWTRFYHTVRQVWYIYRSNMWQTEQEYITHLSSSVNKCSFPLGDYKKVVITSISVFTDVASNDITLVSGASNILTLGQADFTDNTFFSTNEVSLAEGSTIQMTSDLDARVTLTYRFIG